MLGAHLTADREQELDSCQQELDEAKVKKARKVKNVEMVMR
jgi:hypothetical protein